MTVPLSGEGHDSHRCGARKRQSEGTCTRPAGWGTDHPGTGHCKLHGGATAAQTTQAARQRAEEQIRAVLAELDTPAIGDPLSSLLKLAGQVIAWQEATAALVNRLTSIRYEAAGGGEQLRAEVALYERAMDRAAHVLSAIARLNIEERLTRVTERQADAVIGAIDTALAAAGVTGQEAARAKQAAARHLRSA
jgi:hypothetical protein